MNDDNSLLEDKMKDTNEDELSQEDMEAETIKEKVSSKVVNYYNSNSEFLDQAKMN